MEIAINKVHFPVTSLGYGRRVGIWLQGCSIRCPGCINRDTWERRDEHRLSVRTLLDDCGSWLAAADGVTISGGEPFDQPEALEELLRGLREAHTGDILVFSGYGRPELEARHSAVLRWVDVLVSEPYDSGASQTLVLRGSDNQRVALRTERARERYPADIDVRSWGAEPRPMDIVIDGDTLWMAGIPDRRFLAELRAAARARGLRLSGSDQHTRDDL